MEPFEVAIFGVLFEPGERGCGAVDRMLAKAPRLLEIDEVGALDALILRAVHPLPAPSNSLRKDRHLPLCVAVLAIALPADRPQQPVVCEATPGGTCGCRSLRRFPSDFPQRP